MKFSAAAVIAAAAGVSAGYAKNVTYTTEVVDVYTTYCPEPTKITHGGKTYTITEATTFTITDCPCTVTKPVITTSAVVCHNCPGYTNTTVVVVPTGKPTGKPEAPTEVPVAGAGKVAVSGALAAVLGFFALL